MNTSKTVWLISLFLMIAGCKTTGVHGDDVSTSGSPEKDTATESTDTTTSKDSNQPAEKDVTEGTDITESNDLPGTNDITPQADVAEPPKPSENPFNEGPYGITARKIAAPFTLPTLAGEWDFEKEWTGNDSYFFLQYTKSSQGGFSKALWNSSIWPLLNMSPPNVHFFFLSFDEDAEKDVTAMQEKVNKVLDALPVDSQEHWKSRVHFVTQPAWTMDNWVGDVLKKAGYFSFAIDRRQRMRFTGYLGIVGGQGPFLSHLVYQARAFNFEYDRHKQLAAEDVEIVTLIDDEKVKNGHFTATFPSADKMNSFDAMSIDLTQNCEEHLESGPWKNCAEWDYLGHLYLCDEPAEPNALANKACQPKVEASDGVEPVAAETVPCQCNTALGAVEEKVQVCNEEGTGFSDCQCSCNTEVGRWITTYSREGRWVTESTPFLGFLKGGGDIRFRYVGGNEYLTTLKFRLRDTQQPSKPDSYRKLWGGKKFNEKYNEGREPIVFTVPEGTKKVEITTFITGHGFGKDKANCAEFCNHTHHFSVNEKKEYIKEHPEADDPQGCIVQISDGTVPNQYGTWPYGRGGWCPGLAVTAWRSDITESLVEGENKITYKGMLKGKDYVPVPHNSGSGFGANIKMTAYLVYWR